MFPYQEYLASPKSASSSMLSSPYSAKKEERGENVNCGEEGGEEEEELDLTGIDDDEIDTYIMTEREIKVVIQCCCDIYRTLLICSKDFFRILPPLI